MINVSPMCVFADLCQGEPVGSVNGRSFCAEHDPTGAPNPKLEEAKARVDMLVAQIKQAEAAADIPQPPEPGEAAKGGAAGADPFEAGYSREAETKLYRDRITALEAALAQAEAKLDLFRLGAQPNPSPTRSARAEARSDGERELLHDRIPVQEGPARAAKSHRAQPPQPGGHGPTEADRPVMLSELCEALRGAHTETDGLVGGLVLKLFSQHLADRLERKPG